MSYSVAPLDNLAEQFERLPGIGKKTARRLAYYVVTRQDGMAKKFSDALLDAAGKIKYCSVCQNITDSDTREYKGLYHVLHGVISPLDGVGPDQLKLRELMARLSSGEVKEIIIATNPTVEGEATASYISRLVKTMGIKVTRLAYGIPVGGDLEYADEVTLSRALEGRNEM